MCKDACAFHVSWGHRRERKAPPSAFLCGCAAKAKGRAIHNTGSLRATDQCGRRGCAWTARTGSAASQATRRTECPRHCCGRPGGRKWRLFPRWCPPGQSGGGGPGLPALRRPSPLPRVDSRARTQPNAHARSLHKLQASAADTAESGEGEQGQARAPSTRGTAWYRPVLAAHQVGLCPQPWGLGTRPVGHLWERSGLCMGRTGPFMAPEQGGMPA